MGLMKKIFNNTRKPIGFLGGMMLQSMNRGHASVSDWGLSKLPGSARYAAIADLGCGGGRNASRLLELYPDAALTAMDYSEASVEKTRKINARAIEQGRCHVLQGDVSELPFPEEIFDLVTAFETIYFWPGLVGCFRQILQIQKPGGTFLIVNESDGLNPADQKWVDLIDGMTVYNKDQLREMLLEAGFASVEIHHDPGRHWLCVIGRKA